MVRRPHESVSRALANLACVHVLARVRARVCRGAALILPAGASAAGLACICPAGAGAAGRRSFGRAAAPGRPGHGASHGAGLLARGGLVARRRRPPLGSCRVYAMGCGLHCEYQASCLVAQPESRAVICSCPAGEDMEGRPDAQCAGRLPSLLAERQPAVSPRPRLPPALASPAPPGHTRVQTAGCDSDAEAEGSGPTATSARESVLLERTMSLVESRAALLVQERTSLLAEVSNLQHQVGVCGVRVREDEASAQWCTGCALAGPPAAWQRHSAASYPIIAAWPCAAWHHCPNAPPAPPRPARRLTLRPITRSRPSARRPTHALRPCAATTT